MLNTPGVGNDEAVSYCTIVFFFSLVDVYAKNTFIIIIFP